LVTHVAIDLAVAIPVFGDVADAFWKSSSLNMALVERHADRVRPASAGDWLFVTGLIGATAAVALVPLLVLYWIGSLLRR
jgi:thiamine monophosphate kinase